jgi:hypothetical protein
VDPETAAQRRSSPHSREPAINDCRIVPAFSNLSADTQSPGQASFHIELRADTPNEFRPVAFREKRHAQKKQIARLRRFQIGAERFKRRGSLMPRSFNQTYYREPVAIVRSGCELTLAASRAKGLSGWRDKTNQ